MVFETIKKRLKERIREELNYRIDLTDDYVWECIDNICEDENDLNLLPITTRIKLREELFNSLRRMDIIQPLLDDPTITEIMINGKESIFYEKEGKLLKSEYRFDSDERLIDLIRTMVSMCNRVVNEASPIADARLPNKDRVNIIMNPVALNGPIITIRRFPKNPITIDNLVEWGSITEEAKDFLKICVAAKKNIFISGGTGSGKSTLLNALSSFIGSGERVITIEDNAELKLQGIENYIRLEARMANEEGCQEITIRDLIKATLRMRPDRVIVGEIRGEEAFDMLQCMNTGAEGSMSTGHANSAKDMLIRIENMVMMGTEIPLEAIRRQIASALDLIIHVERLRDKTRRVTEIVEILDVENGEIKLNPIFKFEETGMTNGKVEGKLVKCGKIQRITKLIKAGFM